MPVVIGPASDGGYYLLGFTAQIPELWRDMAWGTVTVLEDTEARLRGLGVTYRKLAELDDCDRPEDLAKLAGASRVSGTCLVIPVLNEEKALPKLVASIARARSAACRSLAGRWRQRGSHRGPCAGGGVAGDRFRTRARGADQHGVAAAQAETVCVLHADTVPPVDMVAVIERVLDDPRIALAGFTPLIRGEKTRWGTTAHNWAKTWYAPLLFRPRLFFRGARLLFGDHAMFFRRADFLAVGGCDPRARVMEEADLCIRMTAAGPREAGAAHDRDIRPADRRMGAR